MVAMAVDGPLGEHHVRSFRVERAREGLVMGGVDDGAAVVLAGEGGAGPEDLACLAGFGGANGGTVAGAGSAAEALTAIQVQQNHLVAELGVAGNRAGAAAFWVAGMTAGHDYLEDGHGGPSHQRQTGGGAE